MSTLSSGAMARALAWASVGVALCAAPLPASAQGAELAVDVVWIAGAPELPGRAELWARRIERALRAAGRSTSTDDSSWAVRDPVVSPERVERLAQVEAALEHARSAAMDLREADALRSLALAEREAEALFDVPGASALYVEVELAIAVAASQIGEASLAEAALRRAATVDPQRALGAAEAPLSLLARAREIVREVATAPRATISVRAPRAPDARVWIDERPIARVPAEAQLSPGVHVLRVDAPGHRTYARRIDVHPGTRAALEVELTPEPALWAARALRRAADALDIAGVEAALASLAEAGGAVRAMPARGPIGALWLVRVSNGPIERAVVVPCDSQGCRAPLELEGSTPAEPLAALEGDPLERRGLELALTWLDEPLPEAPPPRRPSGGKSHGRGRSEAR